MVVRFRKAESHTNAPQRHKTLQTMAVEMHEGQAAAARQMAHRAAASSRITAVPCVCARGGKIADYTRDNMWRRTTLSRSQPDIGTRHSFSVDFSIIEIVRTNIRLHHAVYIDLTLGESCKDQEPWPISAYHKQWPEQLVRPTYHFSPHMYAFRVIGKETLACSRFHEVESTYHEYNDRQIFRS